MKKLIMLAILTLGLCSTAFAGNIEIKGSTTVFPIMQNAIEAFMAKHPGAKCSLSGGGSSNGIKALVDGTTDIAMASRKMKDKEVKMMEAKGGNPIEYIVAIDAVIPIVNKQNPVNDLSKAQLRDIYSGKITKWEQVGGNKGRIVVVSRDSSSGTYDTWKSIIMGKKTKVTPRAQMQASSGAVLETVRQNKYAISYDGIGYVDNTVKAVEVDGIAGSIKTARDKSYPVTRTLQIYTNGQPKGEVKQLIDFILGPEGQKIVEEQGFIPLEK